jgi:hypothetical protein
MLRLKDFITVLLLKRLEESKWCKTDQIHKWMHKSGMVGYPTSKRWCHSLSMKCLPTNLSLKVWSPVVVLFWEVLETLGGGAQLKEVVRGSCILSRLPSFSPSACDCSAPPLSPARRIETPQTVTQNNLPSLEQVLSGIWSQWQKFG